jgi:hypothetical protein
MYVPKPDFIKTDDTKTFHTGIYDPDLAEKRIQKEAKKNIYIGLGLIVASVITTIVSFKMLDGVYILYWGPALVGAVFYIKGIYTFSNPYSAVPKFHQPKSGLKNQKSKGMMTVVAALFAICLSSFIVVKALAPQFVNQFNADGGYTKENYVTSAKKACISGGGNDSYCGCVANYLVQNYSLDRLRTLDKQVNANSSRIPIEITAAAKSCIKSLEPATSDISTETI